MYNILLSDKPFPASQQQLIVQFELTTPLMLENPQLARIRPQNIFINLKYQKNSPMYTFHPCLDEVRYDYRYKVAMIDNCN